MKNRIIVLFAVLFPTAFTQAAPAAGAAVRAGFDFETAASVQAWQSKSNTAVQFCTLAPKSGRGCLRFRIDPAKFAYGWINRRFAGPVPADSAGVHGWYRAPAGSRGRLRLYILRGLPKEPVFYGAEIASLDESAGNWTEFYVDWCDLQKERGSGGSGVSPEALAPNDRIQFLASLAGKRPVWIDLDGVDFPGPKTAPEIRRRVHRARLEGLLRPLPRSGPPPPSHPRLLLTPAAVAEIHRRAAADPQVRAVLDKYVADARQAMNARRSPLAALLDFTRHSDLTGIPWRAAFEGRLRAVCRTIERTAAAGRLSGDPAFAKFATAQVLAAARRLTPAFPGFSRGFYYTRSFWVRTLAFAYDWLSPGLTPEQRRTLQAVLLDFVLSIHRDSAAGAWGRHPLDRVWNWDPGIMGACGLGMLALEGETRTAEQTILFDCRRHVRDYLTLGIDFDGCGREGPNYLGYGIGSAVDFAEILRQQGRGDLFTETNWRLIPAWLAADTLPGGGRWNNLGDCSHGQAPARVLLYTCGRLAQLAAQDPARPGEHWASRPLRQPLDYLQHFRDAPGRSRLSYGALAAVMGWVWRNGPGRLDPRGYAPERMLAWLLWHRPLPALEDPGKYLEPSLHFRGRGLVVCRTGFGSNDVYVSVEAGPYAAGHDQADKGSFTLYAYGADLAIDSGYGNDGEPRKSGSSFAHNVVLIDGRGQPMRYHNRSNGWVSGFFHSRIADWVRTDARDAWSLRFDADGVPSLTSPVRRALRQVVFVRPADGLPAYLLVYDDIDKDGTAHAYTWQWHFPGAYRVDSGARPWITRPARWCARVLTSAPSQKGAWSAFRFQAPKAGKYVLAGLVRAGGPVPGKSDSFFLRLDSGPRLLWDLNTGREFRWAPVADRNEPGPHVFQLSAGPHRIRLEEREPQAELARLLLLPAGSPLPGAPGETPAAAVATLAPADAVPGDPGLRLAQPSLAPAGVSLAVFPVHPAGGAAAVGWFETSREGMHRRLAWTVRAVDPRFLAVLLPRRPGTPTPKVRAVKVRGPGGLEFPGARLDWPGGIQDQVCFGSPAKGVRAGSGLRFQAAAVLVRSRGGKQVLRWLVADGRSLAWRGRELWRSAANTLRSGP